MSFSPALAIALICAALHVVGTFSSRGEASSVAEAELDESSLLMNAQLECQKAADAETADESIKALQNCISLLETYSPQSSDAAKASVQAGAEYAKNLKTFGNFLSNVDSKVKDVYQKHSQKYGQLRLEQQKIFSSLIQQLQEYKEQLPQSEATGEATEAGGEPAPKVEAQTSFISQDAPPASALQEAEENLGLKHKHHQLQEHKAEPSAHLEVHHKGHLSGKKHSGKSHAAGHHRANSSKSHAAGHHKANSTKSHHHKANSTKSNHHKHDSTKSHHHKANSTNSHAAGHHTSHHHKANSTNSHAAGHHTSHHHKADSSKSHAAGHAEADSSKSHAAGHAQADSGKSHAAGHPEADSSKSHAASHLEVAEQNHEKNHGHGGAHHEAHKATHKKKHGHHSASKAHPPASFMQLSGHHHRHQKRKRRRSAKHRHQKLKHEEDDESNDYDRDDREKSHQGVQSQLLETKSEAEQQEEENIERGRRMLEEAASQQAFQASLEEKHAEDRETHEDVMHDTRRETGHHKDHKHKKKHKKKHHGKPPAHHQASLLETLETQEEDDDKPLEGSLLQVEEESATSQESQQEAQAEQAAEAQDQIQRELAALKENARIKRELADLEAKETAQIVEDEDEDDE